MTIDLCVQEVKPGQDICNHLNDAEGEQEINDQTPLFHK